ncbi:MAG: DUF58 domain-containing protein [Gemmatimonadetes bacterium]|nr:DUF58 domain-containing protein [Gemmatimonadota bacterium]
MDAPNPEDLFSDAAALQIRQLELQIRGLVDSLFSGEYQSVFRGQGLELSHLREYEVGDDVRAIDWNVTARRGQPYVKQFVEERELTAVLVVDVSGSKDFGTGARANAEIALELAAVLALSANRNNDRVALLLVTDEVELFIPPGTGRSHALRLLLKLLTHRPQGRGTKPSKGLDFVARVCRPRSILFLISDFILDASELEALSEVSRTVALRHDLIPIRLVDSRADELPDVGMVALLDPETGERRVVDAGNATLRESYRSAVAAARDQVSALFRELSLDVIEVDTKESYIPPLMRFFFRRERRYR